MSKPKISVVIPIYNVEKYLQRCVDSVLNQTLRDLEIILVDDGSPDKCPLICDQYAKKDSRVFVIHKKNGGLASARNAGMKAATGTYLFFLDSDDWIDLDGLELLYNTAVMYKTDFVRYRAIRSYWPGLEPHTPGKVEEIREMEGGYYDYDKIRRDIFPRLIATSQLMMGPIVAAWSSLYCREFLIRNNCFFDEQVKYSEDMIFSAKVVLKARNFYYIENACVYHYFFNPSSISKSFRENRWESCKMLINLFENEFSDNNYDFTRQFIYLRWFCIMLGINERKYIHERNKRLRYCKMIVDDEIVKYTELPLKWFDVTLKQKMIMILIKLRMANILEKL